MYKVKEVSRSDNPELVDTVEGLSIKSGIKTPKIMLAQVPIPNAFAYGSPIAGTRVAVTKGLLETLDKEEVEAVIGHELGHLKHRDVQVMMFVSMLPAIFYYVGFSLMWSGGRSDREGNTAALVGIACLALYWVLTLFSLHLSRLREYYADRHSVEIVEDGPRKLSEGLAKIVNSTGKLKKQRHKKVGVHSFKALLISDPDHAVADAIALNSFRSSDSKLVEEVLRKKLTTADRVLELLSTHPNIVKRLRTLQQLV